MNKLSEYKLLSTRLVYFQGKKHLVFKKKNLSSFSYNGRVIKDLYNEN